MPALPALNGFTVVGTLIALVLIVALVVAEHTDTRTWRS